jgi:hypothetical protein
MGLPTGFMRQALEHGRVYRGTVNQWHVEENRFELTVRVIDGLEEILLGGHPISPGTENVPHETTHAILDLLAEDPFWAPLLPAEEYYTDAPLHGGETGVDEFRLTQEAAAEYVGQRWAAMFETYRELERLANLAAPANRTLCRTGWNRSAQFTTREWRI